MNELLNYFFNNSTNLKIIKNKDNDTNLSNTLFRDHT